MKYAEYHPCAALKPYIKCIWLLESSSTQHAYESILPDGCAELLIHYGDPFEKKDTDAAHLQPLFFMYGQISRFIELRPTGTIGVLGVKFYPYGLQAFTNMPQARITDLIIGPNDLFSGSGNDITCRIKDTTGTQQKLQVIQQFLLKLLSRRGKYSTDISSARFAVNALQQGESVQSIASRLNTSQRALQRKFQEEVGLSARHLSKIFRLQQAVKLKGKAANLTDLAYEAGYYDQSHFIRDFKAIAGINPHTFFKKEKMLTDIFISND